MLKRYFVKLMQKYTHDELYIFNCWDEIYNHYTSGLRFYHNLDHLIKMIVELEDIKEEVKEPDTLLFSIYYHDIIYEVTNSDNENRSALFLEERLNQTSFTKIDKCINQIQQTKTHEKSDDDDTNILLDLDLVVLGSNPSEYKKYYQSIRKEYSIYSEEDYNSGRIKVLNKILDQESIYKTRYFINKYEDKARFNIVRELNSLV